MFLVYIFFSFGNSPGDVTVFYSVNALLSFPVATLDYRAKVKFRSDILGSPWFTYISFSSLIFSQAGASMLCE